MTLAAKIILRTPISSQCALEEFVAACIRDKVAWIAVFGPGAAAVEDAIDWIIVDWMTIHGSSHMSEPFIVTTAHSGETMEQVREMLDYGPQGSTDDVSL